MADLDYVRATGRFGLVIGDGAADPDVEPDTVWCDSGTIRITPLIKVGKVAGGDPSPWSVGYSVIDASVNADGYLSWREDPFVWLADLGSAKVNPFIGPGKATHTIDFIDVMAGGSRVTFPSYNVRISADTVDPETGSCDLTLLSPVAVSGGTPIIVGPPGPEGPEGPMGPSGPGGSDIGVAGYISDPASSTRAVLSATYAPVHGVAHLDSYTDFFGGGKWVAGQRTTNTTTTADVAVGASVIPFADVSGVAAGFQFVTDEGTASQKVYTVSSVAANNVTINGAVTYALVSGATLKPLWSNSTHLNAYQAFAHFIANAQQGGAYVITGSAPKVTFLGNSWVSQGGAIYATEITDRIPGATVVNAGVAGNNSAALLARFDTDVPADSKYVVFNEPGVNDDTGHVAQVTQLANLAELVRKIRAIGAVPIYTGHVPLADHVAYSLAMQTVSDLIIGDGKAFPGGHVAALGDRLAFLPEADSIGMGTNALKAITTGTQNTAYGAKALTLATTAQNNTAVGREALSGLTAGSNNTAVGHNALRTTATGGTNTAIGSSCGSNISTGASNVFVGHNAAVLATTAASNVALGQAAAYQPNGLAANATVGAVGQTCVGCQTGQGSAAQADYITVIGFKATATGAGGFAIGADSGGVGAASTAANQGVLGTANHTVKVPGRLNIATRTPTGTADVQGTTGDLAWDDSYVYVKTSAGWKRAALAAW